MATKAEIQNYLKETGYTKEDMQKFWDECIEINWKIKSLDECNKTWEDLNLNFIKQLPTLKEETLKFLKEEEEFEETIVSKIDNKEKLTRNELKKTVFKYSINTECVGLRRCTRCISTIVGLLDRYFCINWEENLPGYKEYEFFEQQPYEVEKRHMKKL